MNAILLNKCMSKIKPSSRLPNVIVISKEQIYKGDVYKVSLIAVIILKFFPEARSLG